MQLIRHEFSLTEVLQYVVVLCIYDRDNATLESYHIAITQKRKRKSSISRQCLAVVLSIRLKMPDRY